MSIASGYSPQYLLKEVATGRENYYTGAVADGEPPGRWWGAGAAKLGLTGLVDAQDMTGVYERFLDPRHEAFKTPDRWDEVCTLGQTGRRYLSEDERVRIADLRRQGGSVRAVAAALGRSPATISRELRRNSEPASGQYRPFTAHETANRRVSQ